MQHQLNRRKREGNEGKILCAGRMSDFTFEHIGDAQTERLVDRPPRSFEGVLRKGKKTMRKKHEKEIRERNMTTDLDTGGDESPTIQFPYWPLIRTISNLLKLVNKASLNSSASHFQVVFHSKRMKRSAPEDLAQACEKLR